MLCIIIKLLLHLASYTSMTNNVGKKNKHKLAITSMHAS